MDHTVHDHGLGFWSLSYSSPRLEKFGISPKEVVNRIQARNINLPGGLLDLPSQKIEVRPSEEFSSKQEIDNVVVAISPGRLPLYQRDMVDVTRGHADPPEVMNFQTVKAPLAPASPRMTRLLKRVAQLRWPFSRSKEPGTPVRIAAGLACRVDEQRA